MSKEHDEAKVNQLSMIEQSIQSLLVQKQNFQAQLMELENASKELKNSKVAYKMISNIMVKADKEELNKDINSKIEILNLRIKNIEKQETKFREKTKDLQADVMKTMKK